jgi:hypothetical protein
MAIERVVNAFFSKELEFLNFISKIQHEKPSCSLQLSLLLSPMLPQATLPFSSKFLLVSSVVI